MRVVGSGCEDGSAGCRGVGTGHEKEYNAKVHIPVIKQKRKPL